MFPCAKGPLFIEIGYGIDNLNAIIMYHDKLWNVRYAIVVFLCGNDYHFF